MPGVEEAWQIYATWASLFITILIGVYKFGRQGQKLDAAATEVDRMKEAHPAEMHERDIRRKEEREQVEEWHRRELALMQANYDQKIAAAQEQCAQAIEAVKEAVTVNRDLIQAHIDGGKESREYLKSMHDRLVEVQKDVSGLTSAFELHLKDHNGRGRGYEGD